MKRASIDDAYPLHWPAGTPRTAERGRQFAKFGLTFGVARNRLVDELRRLGSRYVVLSSNVALKRDGMPYAHGDVTISDPGVAVYFDLEGQQHVIACDKWMYVRDNIRACGLTVEAIRGMERWGSSEIMRRTLTAFRMLPAPANSVDWRHILGDLKTAAELRDRFHALALDAHPDRGGSDERMTELNAAREAAERELGE